jgi:gluconate 2-dehydrogenase gamma chain
VIHSALGFGSYLIAYGTGCKPKQSVAPPPAVEPRSPSGALSQTQLRTVRAACERVLPKDEDPGAIDLGVPEYLDKMLADPDTDFLRRPFMTLIDGVESQAKTKHGRSFADLSAPLQDEILSAWQKGKPGERRSFEVLLALTFEGAFGDPKHGGNRDGRGFAMIGFTPGPPMPLMKMPGPLRGAQGGLQ